MSAIRSVLRAVTPPILLSAYRAVKPKSTELFGGDGRLFEELAGSCKVYGEYGCGQSTKWMLANTGAAVHSVDSSDEWVARIKSEAAALDRLDLRWVDVGRIGDWGRPLGYEKRRRFRDYVFSPWDRGEDPDLVLIDGRFRVASFFATLLRARPGTIVLFDDYVGRAQYEIVEEFVPLGERCGRQACFAVPAGIDKVEASRMLEKFEYVMD